MLVVTALTDMEGSCLTISKGVSFSFPLVDARWTRSTQDGTHEDLIACLIELNTFFDLGCTGSI